MDNKVTQHVMISLGDGFFAGAENTIINTSNEYSGIVMAEQLGRFSEEEPGTIITNENKIFHLVSGALKGSKVSEFMTYKEAVSNVRHQSFKNPRGGICAIAELLSGTGEISVSFSEYLQGELLKNNPVLPKALKIGPAILAADINENLPVGGIICLKKNYGENLNDAFFALRLNNYELFIPALYEPTMRHENKGAIFKVDEINKQLQNFKINQVTFTPERLRVPILLGKDSMFFVKDSILHVRAHGFPGLINNMHAEEMVNVIKALSISKGINLKKIHAIKLESCYGALNWPLIPSSGEAIANILGLKVIAYKGKYKSGLNNENKNQVTFSGTSPVQDLESYVRQFLAEKSIKTVIAIRKMYDYLTNVEPSNGSTREKRSDEGFNAYLLDVGRLILGKVSIKYFMNKYEGFYGINDSVSLIKSQDFLTTPGLEIIL